MRSLLTAVLLILPLAVAPVSAQPASLDYGEDYTWNDEIHQITTVQVAPNRIDHYLAGIERSWVRANEIAMEMDLLHDYRIYVSELPNGGDFNMLLVSVFENAEQRARNQDPDMVADFVARVEASLSEDESFEITEGYTQIREIVGEYMMRQIELR